MAAIAERADVQGRSKPDPYGRKTTMTTVKKASGF